MKIREPSVIMSPTISDSTVFDDSTIRHEPVPNTPVRHNIPNSNSVFSLDHYMSKKRICGTTCKHWLACFVIVLTILGGTVYVWDFAESH